MINEVPRQMMNSTAGDTARDLEHEVSEAMQARRAGGTQIQSAVGEVRQRVGDDWTRSQEAVMRIPVSVSIVLGAVKMPLHKLLALSRGAVIPLDRKVGDLVDIVVNDRVVARGEVVALDEDASRFAVAVREVVVPPEN